MSSSVDAKSVDQAPKGSFDQATLPTEKKTNEPSVVDYDDGEIVKNSKAVSSWTIVASALANFSDGYQNNLSSSTNVVFKHLTGKAYTAAVQTRISNALTVGAVIGIVVLGYICDVFSRKGGMWVTSSLVVIGSLLATLTFQVTSSTHNMLWYLTIARGIAGVGIGGEYPSSAAAALESSNENFDSKRGPIQILTSTLQATSAGPICTLVYLLSLIGSNNNLKVAFHAMYGISIFLPIGVMLMRLQMKDGLLFRKSNFKKNKIQIPYLLILKRYGWRLLGTSAAFFLYDFVNFPNSIMSSAIINDIVPGHNVRTVAIWQFILAILAVPGVIVGSWLSNKIGRKWTGIAGWVGYVVLGFIIGGCYDKLVNNAIAAFVVLYGLMQSFGHMGPGATIGLMSVELYPTAVRGMAYGISAGFGKAGAAIGTEVFTPIRDSAGPSATFYVLGGISVVGAAIYYVLPEGRDLDLAEEDEKFREYLRSEGWQGEI